MAHAIQEVFGITHKKMIPKYMGAAKMVVREVVRQKIRLCGCNGLADDMGEYGDDPCYNHGQLLIRCMLLMIWESIKYSGQGYDSHCWRKGFKCTRVAHILGRLLW